MPSLLLMEAREGNQKLIHFQLVLYPVTAGYQRVLPAWLDTPVYPKDTLTAPVPWRAEFRRAGVCSHEPPTRKLPCIYANTCKLKLMFKSINYI